MKPNKVMKPKVRNPFPCLAKYKPPQNDSDIMNNVIVLFINPKRGIVVSNNKENELLFPVGHYSDNLSFQTEWESLPEGYQITLIQ